MKRFAAASILMVAAVSCSYYTYPVEVEHRESSVTGIDLDGRVLSVSFVYSSPSDSLCQSIMAEHFSIGLENLWFDGKSEIDMFAIRKTDDADYASRDTLVQLAMSTDSDVAFLFDEPEYQLSGNDTTQVRFRLYAYDCLGKLDDVQAFYGTRRCNQDRVVIFSSSGKQFSGHFARQWKSETYNVYYFEESRWSEAAILAEDMRWEDAMKIWMGIVSSTRNTMKQAVASYNIALACHILDNQQLALTWLDKADSIFELGQSPSLRKRIEQCL